MRGGGHSIADQVFYNQFHGDENEKFNCLALRNVYVVVFTSVRALFDADG
jgi:hypothetical protein